MRTCGWMHGARTIDGATWHAISEIARHQRAQDTHDTDITPLDMVAARCADNQEGTRCRSHEASGWRY